MHGGEKYQLRSHFPEKAEVIFIKKTEGFIPRHSDAHRFFQPETFRKTPVFTSPGSGIRFHRILCFHIQPGRAVRQPDDPVYVQGFLQNLRQLPEIILKLRYLIGQDKPEMTAFDHTVFCFRNIAQNRDPRLFFQEIFHPGVKHGGHLVQDHAPDPAVFFVVQKTFYICGQRNAHPLAVYDQDHRRICNAGKIVGAGSGGGSSHAVIISHDALHHRDPAAAGIPGQKIPGNFGRRKKRIQIS